MATGTLVSVEEYLSACYEPDRDYVDGVLEERNVGEWDHGRLQLVLAAYFLNREKQWKLRAATETRVKVSATRFRIPDVCVVLEPGPFSRVLRIPPFICIEITSPKDRKARVQKRIDDFLAFGVPNIWKIDPITRRAFVFTTGGSSEVMDSILRTGNPEIFVPLAEIFATAGPASEPDPEESNS